jgi:hypothetical protein
MRAIDAVVAEPPVDLSVLVDLESDANADGRAIVSRFIEDWAAGRNRFCRGERERM